MKRGTLFLTDLGDGAVRVTFVRCVRARGKNAFGLPWRKPVLVLLTDDTGNAVPFTEAVVEAATLMRAS